MAASAYGGSPALLGSALPLEWKAAAQCSRRSRFGDVAVLVFLLAQCFDGVFTYVGVMSFGPDIEANPLIAQLMAQLGHGPALLLAKMIAASLGILLHLKGVHGAVALLAAFYVIGALVPWLAILLS